METTGIALGIAGLAGLFSACLEILDIIFEGKNYGQSSEKIVVQIDVQYIRFCLWGESVGLWDPNGPTGYDKRLDNPVIGAAVRKNLGLLKLAFENSKKIKDKYGVKCISSTTEMRAAGRLTALDVKSYCENILQRSRTRQNGSTALQRVTWACGKKKLQALLDDLRNFNDDLHVLLPPTEHFSQQQMEAMEHMLSRYFPQSDTGRSQRAALPLSTDRIFRKACPRIDYRYASSRLSNPSLSIRQSFYSARSRITNSFETLRAAMAQSSTDVAVNGANDGALTAPESATFDTVNDNFVDDLGQNRQDQGQTSNEQKKPRTALIRWTHARRFTMLALLKDMYLAYNRLEDAETTQKRLIEGRKKVFGEEHEDTLSSMHDLASMYEQQNRLDEAEALYLIVKEAQRRVLGDEHANTLTTMYNLASTYRKQNRLGEAEALYKHVVEARERVLGEGHTGTLTAMSHLASTYQQQNRLDDAEALCEQVIDIRKRVVGSEHDYSPGGEPSGSFA